MGCNVTILRTRGKDTLPIDGDEIAGAAAAAAGWRYDRGQRALLSTRDEDAGLRLWFADGALWTANPDDKALARMIALADTLSARVRGDEGETWRAPDDAYAHPDDEDDRRAAQAASRAGARRERRVWIVRGVLVAVLVLAAGRRILHAYW